MSDSINQETAAISSDEDNQLKQEGKIKEGIATSDHATELSSDSVLAYYNLGETLARQWRWEEAKAAYSKAIELDPNYFEAHQKLGEALHAAGKLEEAIASYRQAIRMSSNMGVLSEELHSLHFNLGEALQRQGKFEDAIACYHKSLEFNSASARVYHHLGTALNALQRGDESVVVFFKAIELDSNSFWSHRLLAEILEKQGYLEDAYTAYQKAILLQPEKPQKYFALGLTLTLSGKITEAINAYQKAVALDPEYGEPYWNLAWLLSQQNQWDEAIYYSQNAFQLQPEGSDAHFHYKQTSKYTFIKIHELRLLERKLLENAGISMKFLDLIQQDNKEWEQVIHQAIKYSIDMPISQFKIPDFQQKILAAGYMNSFCPISGQQIRTNQSFYIASSELIFYRFVGDEVFYLILGSWAAFKAGIYFPNRDLIISFCHEESPMNPSREAFESYTKSFKSCTVTFLKEFRDYINFSPKELAIPLNFVHNLGHYFWNELSAIQELYETKKLKKVNRFLVGPYKRLNILDVFPEIMTDNPHTIFHHIQEPQTIENIPFSVCLRNNLFVIPLRSIVTTEKLANRLYHSCHSKCDAIFLEKVGESKQHFPLLWITLRSHNRVWLSQIEGIANIIKALSQDYPELGIIFDGVPSEKANLETIRSLIPPTIKTYNALECTLYETIVWSHAIDIFIAPYGAGLIFPCQIVNKTGVAHASERKWLRPNPFCLHPRDNCVSITVVPGDGIDTSPDGRNYHVDWKAIYTEAINLLKNLNYRNN